MDRGGLDFAYKKSRSAAAGALQGASHCGVAGLVESICPCLVDPEPASEYHGVHFIGRPFTAAFCLVFAFSCSRGTPEALRLADNDLRASSPGTLPPNGPAVVGGVQLPSGHQVEPDPSFVQSNSTDLDPVLWLTDENVPDVGALWAQVAKQFHRTGLWPVVLESLEPGPDDKTTGRPWDSGELAPTLSSDPIAVDVESLLRRWWKGNVPSEDFPVLREMLEPFGREFPGLAPASKSSSDEAAPALVAKDLQGRLGLVAVTRPADVPAVLGWTGPTNYYSDMGQLSAVLRSWEDRFGAVVVGLGFDSLWLGVRRPPLGPALSHAVAAAQFAVCPDIVWQGVESIAALGEEIEGQRTWFCWWD